VPGYSPPSAKDRRVLNMLRQMDKEGFGKCAVTGSREVPRPKEVSLNFIAKMIRDCGVAILKGRQLDSLRQALTVVAGSLSTSRFST
jgi:hypothetical protein